MIEQRILSVFLTKDFRELWEEYCKIVEENPRFKELVNSIKTKDGKKDKRIKKSRRDSLRVRFAVLTCLEQMLIDQESSIPTASENPQTNELNNITEENVSTETVNQEEVLPE